MKQLICTADDFGLALPVNEAVEQAYRNGILTCASLMVTAPAAADAVMRARSMPELGVGLHLVLVDGRPALPPDEVPDLVDSSGRFHANPAAIGARIFFQPRLQQQVEREMRAQFSLFLATGLKLDHVNAHHHFHQHPTIVGLLARMAHEFGIRSVRWPVEQPLASWRAQHQRLLRRWLTWFCSAARLLRMRQRLQRANIRCNDHMFGLLDSGDMTPERVARFLHELPDGVSEIYCHPATRHWRGEDALPPHYRCVEEFQAMADPAMRELVEQAGATLTSFDGLHR